jgi:hypothetical protein
MSAPTQNAFVPPVRRTAAPRALPGADFAAQARWAARKGLVLDQNGALLYPGESGPFVPRSGHRNGRAHAQDLLELPNDAFDQNRLL